MKSHTFRLLSTFLLVLAITTVQAQPSSVSLQVVPQNPTTATPIRVHLTVQGCLIINNFHYERAGSTFDIRMQHEDYCHPDLVVPERYLDIGLLPPGEYLFRYFGCGFAPPGEVVCTQTHEETIVVTGMPVARPVPSFSLFGKWTLAALMLIGAVVFIRR